MRRILLLVATTAICAAGVAVSTSAPALAKAGRHSGTPLAGGVPSHVVAARATAFKGAAPGRVTCTFNGEISFSPHLTNAGGGTHPSKISGTMSGCSTSNRLISISGGTVKGSFSRSPIVCAGPAGAPASATLTTKWRGSAHGVIGGKAYSGAARFTKTTTAVSGSDFTQGTNFRTGLALPGSGSTATVTGSFPATGPKGALLALEITGNPNGGCRSASGLATLTLTGTVIEGSLPAESVSCCIAPPGSPNLIPLEPGYNLADPGITPLSSSTAEVYTTESFEQGAHFYNVPSYTVNLAHDTYSDLHDALPTPPSWYGSPNDLFAPSVRFIAGRYVMTFAASPGSNALCIGEATSADGLTFVANSAFEICTAGFADFDPQLFIDPNDGTVWLFYSLENGPDSGTIESQQLTADASGLIGSPTTLLTYSQVASLNLNEGSAPFLENPAFVADPSNGSGFDLLASLGTCCTGSNEYVTIQVPCSSETGPCQSSHGQLMMGTAYGDDAASAALLKDNSPTGNYIIWDQWINGVRMDFLGPTTSH